MGANHRILYLKDVMLGFLSVRDYFLLTREKMAFLMTARLFYQQNPQLAIVRFTQARNGGYPFIPGEQPWQTEVDPGTLGGMSLTELITLMYGLLELTQGILSTVAKNMSTEEGAQFVHLLRHNIHLIENTLGQAEREKDPLGFLQRTIRHYSEALHKKIKANSKKSKHAFDMKQSTRNQPEAMKFVIKTTEIAKADKTGPRTSQQPQISMKREKLNSVDINQLQNPVMPSSIQPCMKSDLSVETTVSKEQTPVNREQQECYRLLLSDVKRSPVKFIQSIYKEETGKIVVNIKWGKRDSVSNDLKKLINFQTYSPHLEIQECDPSTFLMQNSMLPTRGHPRISENDPLYNIRVGSGSLIAGVKEEELEEILDDKSLSTLNEVKDKYFLGETGTLTCLAKSNGKFYAMTSQHVMHKRHSSGRKPTIAQVCFETQDLLLTDFVHLSSSYHGCLNTIAIGSSENVVDVTLLPINQTKLDEKSLKLLKVFTRTASHGPDARQNSEDYLQGKIVTKKGAVTGETKGRITHPSHYGKVDPTDEDSVSGEMFGVISLNDQPFALPGDSGAIVMITVPKEDQGGEEEQVLGILSQLENKVALCVRMEDCMEALESIDSLDDHISSSTMQIYTGFLKPLVAICDRRKPHVEVEGTAV